MATNFPTNLDSLTNPISTDSMSVVPHADQHANANDAIEALEAKVGVNSSAVTTSHDYKLSEVTSTDKAVGKTTTQTLTNKTLTAPQINMNSDATGDMLYRASSGSTTRLPIGTSGQILNVGGTGIPVWIANPAAADASTTVKGVVEEATQAEIDAGTATGSTGARLFINPSTAFPTGTIMMYGGSTSPTAWNLCDGSAISRTTYANLFAIIGTTYGTGDGSTTFNVPDMRGRVPIGVGTGTGGGSSGTGLPTGGSSLTNVPRAGWKGEENHTMTLSELVAHTHTVGIHNGGGSATTNPRGDNGSQNSTYTSSSTGSTTPFNVIQPVIGLNFIIRL